MTTNTDNGYQLVSAVFLRLLGGIYLIAFALRQKVSDRVEPASRILPG